MTFEQTAALSEVATLRMLCPTCMQAYRARKAAQGAGAAPERTAPPSAARAARSSSPSGLPETGRRGDAQRPAELRPVERQPFADKRPAGPPPSADKRPAGLPPSADKRPAGLPPSADKRPAGSPPSADKRPAGLPPSADKRPAGPPPSADKRPVGLPPSADKRPAGPPSSAEKQRLIEKLSAERGASAKPSARELAADNPDTEGRSLARSPVERRSTERRSAEKPSAARPAGERRSTQRRSAGAEVAAEKARPKKHIDLDQLQSRSLKKSGTREVLIGFGLALLVLGAAGYVLNTVVGKKRAESAALEVRLAEIEAFRSEFMAIEMTTEEGAQRLIAFSDEHKDEWVNEEFAPDVTSRTAKAKTFLDGLAQRRELVVRLENVEAMLARAAELAPSELAEQRRRLDDLSAKAAVLGEEFSERLAKDRQDAERAYLDRLVAVAREAAAKPTLDRAALADIQQAEDEILKVYEASFRAWQKDTQNPELAAAKDALQDRYQGIITLSDEAVERYFTPEVIENAPWRDLLSADHAAEWRGATVKGFEFRVTDGVMHLVGPDPSEKSEGVISIGDKEAWRDFVLDVEITVLKGQCSFFFRLPPVWQENVELYDFSTAEDGTMEAGRTYAYSFRVLGSTLIDEQLGEDSLGPTVNKIRWTQVRKGALGISLPKDSEVKFTRLRAKVLR